MPEVSFSPTEVGYIRHTRSWEHPSFRPSLHRFNTRKPISILKSGTKIGRALCGIKIYAVDPVASEGTRLKICYKCFKGVTGYAELGWVVVVVLTDQGELPL